ncbi:hypothetical protein EDI_123990 [Entamoeba dispar SAW760]|uniref:Uncharacterized protein n=1 Tax=Entamoeba dispar (strain ATCC PRA-260 / SAW760) TaxID=370354 RepID=B0ER25_ENTDS|nr:uncharacterized protein EDI_123990 [Entamoeba dispar SAW760]EDR23034.1 hypothetical protein EDI_123990 [Entamoeba dispar SAW760]|eukprot:EDR23034.1 hypothetical protein EDI_123990 [Entamoeba dispar SAW760]
MTKEMLYCSIPIIVNEHNFQLLLSSYDKNYIYSSSLIQTNQKCLLHDFIPKQNRFIIRYYKEKEFPITLLMKLSSFSFGSFNGYFKRKWFETNKLKWYKYNQLAYITPHFISIPLCNPSFSLSQMKCPFSISFLVSNQLACVASNIHFILMENMEVIEEKTIKYDLNSFYCNFITSFNQLHHQSYLRVVIDLLNDTETYIDSGCYLFDEQGYLLKEKLIGFTKREINSNKEMKDEMSLLSFIPKTNNKNDYKDKENWFQFKMTLRIVDYNLSYCNETKVFNKNGMIYENGYLHSFNSFTSIKNVKTLQTIFLHQTSDINESQIYFQTENNIISLDSVLNSTLFGNLKEINKEFIDTLKSIQIDTPIDYTFIIEVVKRRFWLLEIEDLELCRNVLLCIRIYCDYGENMLSNCYEWLYDRVISSQMHLTLLDLLLFSTSGFIDFSISLFHYLKEQEILSNLSLLVLFLISLQEKSIQLLPNLLTLFSKPQHYIYFYKMLWLLLEKFDHKIAFMDEWFFAFTKQYHMCYPDKIIPSIQGVIDLISLILNSKEKDNHIVTYPLLQPFSSIPISSIQSKIINTSLEHPIIIIFLHIDNSKSMLLFKFNKTTIESNLMIFMKTISQLCSSSYQTYQIYNISSGKFVEFIPDCIPYSYCRKVIPQMIQIPFLLQLDTSILLSNELLQSFQNYYENYCPSLNSILQPQYVRKKNFIESCALVQIFWSLCLLLDRHFKNVLFNPLTGNIFHIDLTFARSSTSQFISPIQYFISEGFERPLQILNWFSTMKEISKQYVHIIFQNKIKLCSLLTCFRRSSALQIDTMIEILYLPTAEKLINENKRLNMLQKASKKVLKKYSISTSYK